MQKLSNEKEFYFQESIWSLTINPAIRQHRRIFKLTASRESILHFKDYLHSLIKMLFTKYYKELSVTENKHIANIILLSEKSTKFKNILHEGKINIGTSQKILNLYLKQMWCLHYMKHEPPHLPIDRIVLRMIKVNDINWTEIDDIKEYKILISKLKDDERFEKNNRSLAQLELFIYNEYIRK